MVWDISRAENASYASLSNNDKTVTTVGGIDVNNRLIIPLLPQFEKTTGTFYWETVHDTVVDQASHSIGAADPDDLHTSVIVGGRLGNGNDGVGFYADTLSQYNGVNQGNGIGISSGGVVGHLFNLDNGEYRVSPGATGSFGSPTIASTTRTYTPAFGAAALGEVVTIRTEVSEFSGAIPPGAQALGATESTLQLAEVSTSEGVVFAEDESLRVANINSSESIASPAVTQTLRVATVQSSTSITPPAYNEAGTDNGIDTETLRVASIQTSTSVTAPAYNEAGTDNGIDTETLRVASLQTSTSVAVTPRFYLFGANKYLTSPCIGLV